MYRELYEEVFGYDKVEIFFNLSRDEMIAKLNELEDEAKVFSQNHAERTILALDVIYIGFKLTANHHRNILIKKRPPQYTCTDGSKTINEYILTQDGHVLNLPEFIERIAQNSNVQVGLLEDWQS